MQRHSLVQLEICRIDTNASLLVGVRGRQQRIWILRFWMFYNPVLEQSNDCRSSENRGDTYDSAEEVMPALVSLMIRMHFALSSSFA